MILLQFCKNQCTQRVLWFINTVSLVIPERFKLFHSKNVISMYPGQCGEYIVGMNDQQTAEYYHDNPLSDQATNY